MALPFFTIGHSTRAIEAFLALLREAEIELVADIRTVPRSRANPQFDKDALPAALAPAGIGYEHIAALGGLRGKAKTEASGTNAYWTNQSFHNYADYALTPAFEAGLEHLIEEGRKRRCAVMCSEAVWWRCHRRIVADYLLAAGETVFHILGAGHIELAQLTPGAVIAGSEIVYPGG